MLEGPGADSEEKRVLASDLDTVMVDSLKALDLIRPIREADIRLARSASLFDPEFTPARRTDFTVNECAGVRLLKQRAVAAPLIALWCVLIFGRLLSHLSGSFLNWGKRGCGSCCTGGQASNDKGSSGWCTTPLSSRSPGHFTPPLTPDA